MIGPRSPALALALLPALVACNEPSTSEPLPDEAPTCLDADVPVSPAPELPLRYQTDHLDIYVDPELFLCAGSAIDYDRHVEYVADQLELDLDPDRRIPVYLTEHVVGYCRPGNAGCVSGDGKVFASSGLAYHELTHGLACEMRINAAAILAEGLAVAFEPMWISFSDNPPEFAELSINDGFPYYSDSGHFIRWLLERLSPAEFRSLYALANYDDGVWNAFLAAYGPTLEQDYADTKPYIWIEHRQCDDMPLLEANPEGGWTVDVTLDCDDESTYGPYERTSQQNANGSTDMLQSFVIDVPAPGFYSVTSDSWPDAYMTTERCLPVGSYATKEEFDANTHDDLVWLGFQNEGTHEFRHAGLHRINVLHPHGPPIDVLFTFTPTTP